MSKLEANTTVYVTDKFMIMALKEAQIVLSLTGYRWSNAEIEERTEEFRILCSPIAE